MLSNYERMIQLAEDTFAVKNDPSQLDVDEKVITHLLKIHPSTVSEKDDGDGPVAWILLIPTTEILMRQFLNEEISEKELYERTPLNEKYDAVYLCSAMVLEEYRKKGIAKTLTLSALQNIRRTHPVQYLFVWNFSAEGAASSSAIAQAASLPLLIRK